MYETRRKIKLIRYLKTGQERGNVPRGVGEEAFEMSLETKTELQ